jgi:hypothetical protein
MRLRLTVLSIITLFCSTGVAQEPSSPRPKPTLTNDDVRLAKAANLAAKQYVTGNEIVRLLEQTQSFRSHAIIDEGDYLESDIEVVPPDRFRFINHVGEPGGHIDTEQLIAVHSFVYSLSRGATRWRQTEFNDDLNTARRYVLYFLPWFFSVRLKAHGLETVDGVEVLRYELDEGSQGANAQPQGLKVWVRVVDGLPLKIILDNKERRPRYFVTFRDYNQPLRIEPPAM